MLSQAMMIASATGLLFVGVGANEMSHGALAEGMGLGHQHMYDYDGYHCADPGNGDWEAHVAHMHNGWNGTGDPPYADHCGTGHMGGTGHHGTSGGMMQ